MDFGKKYLMAYERLNERQRAAVDTIDGPVVVLAGPGTGKTQLLAMRVANILRETDMNPSNILCLTFTDAASTNMTERMARLFGAAAYDVAVHTFHSFATNVFGRYSEYFFRGDQFQPADELSKLEILNNILRALPHKNPLSGMRDEQAIHLGKVKRAISDVKRRGGLSPEKLAAIAAENLRFIDFGEPIFVETFAGKMSASDIPKYKEGYEKLASYVDEKSTLAQTIINDMADAVNDAIDSGKTNAVTAFKNRYFNPRSGKMRDRTKSENIAALAGVYTEYQSELNRRRLYDFDDMIVELIDKLESNADFRADLQEQYQYILIDEFQDTNDAQMQILTSLAETPDSNIMVVGDDDQAIFSFQGANLNNFNNFMQHYPNAKLIQLYENYRSVSNVLSLAEQIVGGVNVRIKENFFESLNNLLAVNERVDHEEIRFIKAANEIDEAVWVAEQTARELAADGKREIAIITREHRDLIQLLPYLYAAGVTNIEYERLSNVLDSQPIRALEILARTICYVADGAHDKANHLMPELLAHPAWNIPAQDIWRLSLATERSGRWLETIMDSENEKLRRIAEWLIEMSQEIKNQTMENAIDTIFDRAYKNHYFGEEKITENPNLYLEYLSDLITLREKIRDYKTESTPSLATFIEVIDLYRRYDQKIVGGRKFGDLARVHLMSVHKSKGLEFDTVIMYHGTRAKWLKNSSEAFFPSNIRLNLPHELDENLRLIFVAATRAKHRLFITAPIATSKKGDDLTILPVLGSIGLNEVETNSPSIDNLETAWNAKYVKVDDDLHKLLSPRLADYKLNATAVNSFTNLEYSSPEQFLMNSLLNFPSAKSPNADYGTAVHETLKWAHGYYQQNQAKPNADAIEKVFGAQLKSMHMFESDFKYHLGRGTENLPKFIAAQEFNSAQHVEQRFDARVGEMSLTGKIDLIEIDEKTKDVIVYDYKTGSSFDKFNSGAIKTHNYWQQLMFYKLLIENANNRPGLRVKRGVICFVEAGENETQQLEIDYDQHDMADFTKLLESIWQRIMKLDFPDVGEYPKNLRGTLDFEKWLIANS